MRRLLITATIAALAFATTAQAKPHKQKKAARQVVAVQRADGTTAVVAPARTVVRNYSRSSGYYGGRYYNGYPYRYGSSGISIGIGTGYPGYGYGYGDPYAYGYGYPYNSGYAYGGGSVVADVQVRLARRGYYHGTVDGVAGPRTRRAIARWEATHGLIADGRIDRTLLRSLGLS